MYISSFHINGFGLFSNVEVENLAPGINIFLGSNEAGKSTCLDFLRAMLTGYLNRRSRDARRTYEPARGVSPGGSINVKYLGADGTWEEMLISRKPDGNPPVLKTPDGKSLSPDLLDMLLAGVSRDVYRKVFGFSLGELERFDNLTAPEVRNALYGASFGVGIVSPAEALKVIQKRKEDIFKPRASRPRLNEAFGQLDALREKILACSGNCEEYSRKCIELETGREELADLKAGIKALEAEKRQIERRLGFWSQWEQWRQQKSLLEHLPPVTGIVPEDAIEIMSRLRGSRESGETRIAALEEKLEQLRLQLAQKMVDEPLLEKFAALRQLSGHKESYRKAVAQIPVQKDECERIQRRLEEELARLGPDWDCERIRATNRSIFNRDNLEKQAEELTEVNLVHTSASVSLDKANEDVQAAMVAVEKARELLATFPEPVIGFDDYRRDELRHNMNRLDDCRREEPGRQKSLNMARDSFVRSLNQANIIVPPNTGDDAAWQQSAGETLDNLMAHQSEALTLSADLQKHIQDSEHAAAKLAQAEEKVDGIRRQMDEIKSASLEGDGPGRNELDARTRALRNLRSVSASLESDEERLKEIDARIAGEVPPSRAGRWIFLTFGLICILCGIAALSARWMWGMTEVDIAQTTIPLTPLAAYAAIVIGAIFLAGGLPTQELKRHRLQMEQLRITRESCLGRLKEHRTQIDKLFAEAGVDTLDPIALDAKEALIEREKEKCFNEERSRREMDRLIKELNNAREHVFEWQANAQREEREVQQCRRRWLELMQTVHVGGAPTPESCNTVFARAEAARLAYGNYLAAMESMNALWEELHVIEEKIVTLPAIARKLEEAPEPIGMEEAVHQLFEEFREADMARERRIHAQADLKNCETELARAREKQAAAATQLEEITGRLNAVRKSWSELLRESGLGMELDPQAMREAYIFMENCISAEQRLQDTRRALAQNEKEMAAFATPLEALLHDLGRKPATDPSGNPDWLATLDSLLHDAEDHSALKAARENLAEQINSNEINLGSENAALKNIIAQMEALFEKGGAANAEEFLTLARQKAEREEILRSIANLDSTFAVAAGQEPVDEFLASFETGDREAQAERLGEVKTRLADMNAREEELSANMTTLAARTEFLAHGDELAIMRQEESILLEKIQNLVRDWCENALAEALLNRAKNIFEKERQPEVIKVASDIFRQITNGRWRGINATLDDNDHIYVMPEHGDPVSPEYLSRGAQEQIYLALRLAYIRNHAEHATSLPVIMDEILVNFDPERAGRTARAFARMASATGRCAQQILYFTCQPHMVDILRSASPGAPLFMVENGSIHAA